MKRLRFSGAILVALVFGCFGTVISQKAKPSKAPRPIIFAVLNDGKTLEPIAYINKSRLEDAIDGSDDGGLIAAFSRIYYKPGTSYKLIFGSAGAGVAKVKASNPKADCTATMATVAVTGAKIPLKGMVMGLATNAATKERAALRRKPTAAEKSEVDSLARAEFAKNKLVLPEVPRYHNLTALDLENDGKAELVGSYWVEIDAQTRGLLFFIAGKGSNGKYSLGFTEFRTIDQSGVMSGDITHVDSGKLHELLLDAFDYDGDGTSNIFTYTQSFEGASFTAYSKSGGKWVRSFEGSNYHCAF